MRHSGRSVLAGVALLALAMAGCGAVEEMARAAGDGELADRWRTGDRLYGTVSAVHTVGTIERGEYRINVQGDFELRYSRSLRAFGGNSDGVRVSLTGRQRVRSGAGEIIEYTMRGDGTVEGSFEILLDEDGTYAVRFFSDRIDYVRTSRDGHTAQGRGGQIGTEWGLGGNPIPADRRGTFAGSGVYQSPDEEGMAGRGTTQLSWSFSMSRE